MPELPPASKRVVPEAFHRYRHTTFERTVRLTNQAIAKLEADGQTVTLARVCETTRLADERNKGLRPTTILRNPQAAELFRQHSPAYQQRRQKAQKANRTGARTKIAPAMRAIYQGMRAREWIRLAEDLKAQIAGLTTQCEELRLERQEAYRLRDEALQQNTRQVASLTMKTQLASDKES